MDDKIKYGIAVMAIISIFTFPFLVNPGAGFGGADAEGSAAIQKQSPGYQPWAKPLWQPPPETESMLFALQAAIGSVIIGYFIGYEKARSDFGHKKE